MYRYIFTFKTQHPWSTASRRQQEDSISNGYGSWVYDTHLLEVDGALTRSQRQSWASLAKPDDVLVCSEFQEACYAAAS